MYGFTPAEQARRDALEAMTPAQRQRAAWYADARRVLDAAGPVPVLPVPVLWQDQATFTYYSSDKATRAAFAAAETALAAALGVTFTGHADERERDYILEAPLDSGLTVRIVAPAKAVAARQVTGTRTVETVNWVRLPAGDQAGTTAGTAA